MGLLNKSEAYLGVDIGAGGIKLVELHKTKGRPQLWTYGIADEPIDIHVESNEKATEDLIAEDRGEESQKKAKKKMKEGFALEMENDPRVERYANILKELLKSAKVTTRKATASLPVSYIFHSTVNLPYIEDTKKRDHIVRAEIEKVLTRSVDEMQIVYQEIPQTEEEKQKKYIKLLVTAAPKYLVSFYTAIFQKAGLELQELETEAFALERSLVGRDKTTSMVVDIGSERTNFFIMDNGLPLTHRSIQIGGNNIDQILESVLGVGEKEVFQINQDISLLELNKVNENLFDKITDQIIKEIQYGFDLYLSQSSNQNKRPEKIILTGGSAHFPPIIKKIKDNFDIKVFVGDPWARVVYQQGLKILLDQIGPRMSVGIGLALRNLL